LGLQHKQSKNLSASPTGENSPGIDTCEALKATAPPPEKSLRRLVRYAEFYRDLAAAAIARGQDVDRKVWVRESDVLAAKASRGGFAPISQAVDHA